MLICCIKPKAQHFSCMICNKCRSKMHDTSTKARVGKETCTVARLFSCTPVIQYCMQVDSDGLNTGASNTKTATKWNATANKPTVVRGVSLEIVGLKGRLCGLEKRSRNETYRKQIVADRFTHTRNDTHVKCKWSIARLQRRGCEMQNMKKQDPVTCCL